MAAEDAGTIAAQIRLELNQLERDGLQAQKMMDHYAKEFQKEGEKGGKMYVQGFGKGQLELNKKLNEMVSTFQGISPKMGAFGEKLAGLFSKPIFRMIPAVSTAFQAMLPVIGTVLIAVGGLAAGVSKALMSNEKFASSVAELKSQLGQGFSASVRPVAEFFSGLIQKAAESTKRANVLKQALKELKQEAGETGESTSTAWKKATEEYSAATEELKKLYELQRLYRNGGDDAGAMDIEKEIDKYSSIANKAGMEMAKLSKEIGNANSESYKVFEDIVKETSEAEKQIELLLNKNAIDEKEANEMKVSTLNNYINKVSELAAKEGITHGGIIRGLEEQINKRKELEVLLKDEKKSDQEKSDQEKITEARNAANAAYEKAVRKARDDQKAGLATEAQMQERINQALAQKYDALEDIVAEYKLSRGETVRQRDIIAKEVKLIKEAAQEKERQRKINELLTTQEDELEKLKIDQLRTLAESAKTEAEKNNLLNETIDKENTLILKIRERQKAEEMAVMEFAGPEAREKWEEQFDFITQGLLKTKNVVEDNPVNIFDTKGWQRGMSLAEASIGAFDSISSAALDVSRKHAEEQIAIIDSALQKLQEQIEAAREAELEAAGFIEAQSEEEFDKQIEAAKAAGDEVLQYQLQRRKQEMEINKKYDEQAKAAEEKAAKEKADIQYQLAKEEYAMQIIQSINAGIMAFLNAIANPPGPPWSLAFGAISAAASGAQIGMLIANPPKPPSFETGGIVPGNSYSGDKIPAMVNSGELILNRAQQDTVAGQLEGGEEIIIHNYIVLDGEVAAKNTARYFNSQGSMLEKRATRGLS